MTTIYIVDGSASMEQRREELKETLRLHGVKEFFLAKPNGLSLLESWQVDDIKFETSTPIGAIDRWLKAIDLTSPESVMFITDDSPEYQIKGLTEQDPDSPIGRINWLNIRTDEDEDTMHDDEFPDEHEHAPEEPYNSSFHVTDDEGRHYLLSINLTDEGMILDLYDRYGEQDLASWAREWDEVGQMVYDNDPRNINPQGNNPLFDEVLEVLVARNAITEAQADALAHDQHIIDELWEDEIGPMLDRLQGNIFSRLSGKAVQFYRIQNIEHGDDMGLFWSNELGWTDKIEADTFTQEERNDLNLPMGGQWVKA